MGNTDNVNGDCERIIGNANGDTINATAADQGVQLFGRLGNDTLTDSAFNDLLNGEGGTDTGELHQRRDRHRHQHRDRGRQLRALGRF